MRLGLTQEQEAAFLYEAEAKIRSLEDHVKRVQNHLELKENALSFWTKRRNRLRRQIAARQRRK